MTELRPPTPGPYEPVTCAECVFAVPIIVDHDAEGNDTPTPVVECHRFPPTAIVTQHDGEGTASMLWPQVLGDDWCGEGLRLDEEEPTDE